MFWLSGVCCKNSSISWLPSPLPLESSFSVSTEMLCPRLDILRTSAGSNTALIFEVRPALSFSRLLRLGLCCAVCLHAPPWLLSLWHWCPLPRRPSLAVLPKSGSLLSPGLRDFLSSSYHPRACPFPSVSSHRWTLSTRKAELMLSHPSSILRAEPRAWHTHVQCVGLNCTTVTLQACDSCQEHLLPQSKSTEGTQPG